MKNGSTSICSLGILAAMMKAEEFLGSKGHWQGPTEAHRFITAMRHDLAPWLREQDPKKLGLATFASRYHDVLNGELRKAGYDIQLQPFGREGDFGTVAIFEREVQWLKPGDQTSLRLETSRNSVPAFTIKQAQVYQGLQHPVVVLDTKQGDRVIISRCDQPISGLELLRRVSEMANAGTQRRSHDYKGATIPMVDMEDKPDISFLLGLGFNDAEDGLPAVLTQALQQNRYKMDHIGARVESATALGATRGISMEQPYQVNGPFQLAVETNNVIVFAAYIGEDVMRQPRREGGSPSPSSSSDDSGQPRDNSSGESTGGYGSLRTRRS